MNYPEAILFQAAATTLLYNGAKAFLNSHLRLFTSGHFLNNQYQHDLGCGVQIRIFCLKVSILKENFRNGVMRSYNLKLHSREPTTWQGLLPVFATQYCRRIFPTELCGTRKQHGHLKLPKSCCYQTPGRSENLFYCWNFQITSIFEPLFIVKICPIFVNLAFLHFKNLVTFRQKFN